MDKESYNSQYGQDKFIDKEIFKGKTGGIFLEIGADNGINGSNTLFFERERGWTGICIEPRTSAYAELIKNRNCKKFNVAIAPDNKGSKKFLQVEGNLAQLSGLVDKFDPRHLDRIKRETQEKNIHSSVIDVESITLNEILDQSCITQIDYLSLDTEGGELEILKSIDYNRFNITCITVENKYEDKEVRNFLSSVGYRKVARLKIDDIFVLKKSPFNTYHEPLEKQLIDIYRKLKQAIKKLINRK